MYSFFSVADNPNGVFLLCLTEGASSTNSVSGPWSPLVSLASVQSNPQVVDLEFTRLRFVLNFGN